MARTKVLYVIHNHPALYPGGAETYAMELFESLRETGELEPLLVARIGPDPGQQGGAHPGTPFSAVDGRPGEYFVFTETDHFDFFHMTSRDKSLYSTHFADFLRTHRPDIVHFQHTLFIGYDLISLTRRVLPHAPILYTLHEYLPICHRDGQLLRTPQRNNELCLEASPRRCNECFPEISRQEFFLRERFIKSHLAHVDLFLAPSVFLLERYVEWGIARERIMFEDYGRRPPFRPEETVEDRPRNRLGFFGQLSPYKGAEVLLRAMQMLADRRPDVHLRLHGANAQFQPEPFKQEFDALLRERGPNVSFAGSYQHANLPWLMRGIDWVVVPSRWWENSPLVIQEAFMQRRPVICSDIGGMAEKVMSEVDGLYFTVGDPGSLAAVIERAASEPGLWERLREGIPAVFSAEEHVANLTRIYRGLLERKREAVPQPALSTEAPC